VYGYSEKALYAWNDKKNGEKKKIEKKSLKKT
jgi:hypothetical protein